MGNRQLTDDCSSQELLAQKLNVARASQTVLAAIVEAVAGSSAFGEGRHDFRPVGTAVVRFLVGAEVNSETCVGKGEFVAGEESSSSYSLSVDLGAVGAAEVPDKKKTVCFHNDAVQLGDARPVDVDVAHTPLPTNDGDVFGQNDRVIAVYGDKLGEHCSASTGIAPSDWEPASVAGRQLSNSFEVASADSEIYSVILHHPPMKSRRPRNPGGSRLSQLY